MFSYEVASSNPSKIILHIRAEAVYGTAELDAQELLHKYPT